MNQTSTPSSPPRRGGRWLRLLSIFLGILLLLVVVGYFVVTSSGFLKSQVLPRVGKKFNAEVSASDVSLSPFKQIVLRDLVVRTTGTDPLFSAAEVRVRYSLMKMIRGNFVMPEVSVASPKLTLVENADGSSNLDPILKAWTPSEEPLIMDLGRLSISNATIQQVKIHPGGSRDVTEISKANLIGENLANGKTGKLAMDAALAIRNNPPTAGAEGSLSGLLDGEFSIAFDDELLPKSIKGISRARVVQADGTLAQASGFTLSVDCDVTPSDVKQVLVQILSASTPIAEMRVFGPFDMEKKEGTLQLQLTGVDRRLFNLAGASTGLDFGTTTLRATNTLVVADAGKSIQAGGQINLDKFQVIRTNQASPTLDLSGAYNITVNMAGNAVINGFRLSGIQNGRELLRGGLSSPMPLAWGAASNQIGDSVLDVTLTNLDLAAWNTFTGDLAPAGILNGQLKLVSRQAGKMLSYDVLSEGRTMTLLFATNKVADAGYNLQISGVATNLEIFQIPLLRFQFLQRGQELMSVLGSGRYELTNNLADLQFVLQAALPRLAQLAPVEDLHVSGGGAEFRAKLLQQQDSQTLTGSMLLTNLNARFGSNVFKDFTVASDLDIRNDPHRLQVRNLSGKLSQAGKVGGTFDITGVVTSSNNAAQFTSKLTSLNENGLRPVLEPMLAGKQLVSVLLNANTTLSYDPAAASSVKGTILLTNLVVKDPAAQSPLPALDGRVAMDLSMVKDVAEIRQLDLGLTPTARATNVVQLSGKMDMAKSNAITGQIKLVAHSLDLTRYYDLFMGAPATSYEKPTERTVSGAPPISAPGTEQEPEPMPLPFQKFRAEANIGRFYLHEVDIKDLTAAVLLDGGKASLDPLKLTVNGGAVDSRINLDLGVPGFRYDLRFSASQMPLAPLVNSFQPERRGQVSGTLSGSAEVAGAGTTGPNLSKNLAGKFEIGTTNLNLAIPSLRSPLLKTIINVIAIVPDLVKNPDSKTALTSLTGAIFGGSQARPTGGLMDDLMQSPLDVIQARGAIGAGRVALEDSLIQSPAFQARAKGTIEMRDILTNSTLNIPLSISLKRSLAEKISLVPAGTPTNAVYVKLPDYVAVKGTMGEPKADINKLALLGTALQQFGGNIPGVDTRAGNLLQNLGGVLTGGNQQRTNTVSASGTGPTNVGGRATGSQQQAVQGTNRPTAADSLLRGLGGILGGATSAANTNAPGVATNAPAGPTRSTNQTPVGNLLDQLLRPK